MEGKDLEGGSCLEHPWEQKGGVLSCVRCCTKGRTNDMTVTNTLLPEEEADNKARRWGASRRLGVALSQKKG